MPSESIGPSLKRSLLPTVPDSPNENSSDLPTQSIGPSMKPSSTPSISIDPSSASSIGPRSNIYFTTPNTHIDRAILERKSAAYCISK
eukprot:scaffold157681_cov47-Attheya_sp.AAC.1